MSLPPHVTWFDINQVHDNEKKGLPEFFADEEFLTPSKNPEMYVANHSFTRELMSALDTRSTATL